MNDRHKILFQNIIKEYVATARPVSSSLLVEKYGLDVSPATVRNDMMELEEEGYLTHPHTSAGRIPTEEGYRFYIANFLTEKEPSTKEKKWLSETESPSDEVFIKTTAKKLADLSSETVIVGFSQDNVYYTGIAHLFQKPEFAQLEVLYNFSEVVDHLDDMIPDIFEQLDNTFKVLIGEENPVSHECAMILSRIKTGEGGESIIGILGPMRMDYDRNIPRLHFIQQQIDMISKL